MSGTGIAFIDIDATGTDNIRDFFVIRGQDTVFSLNDTRLRDFSRIFIELTDGYIHHRCGGINLEVRAGHPLAKTQQSISMQFIDTNMLRGTNAYWVKAVQGNGHTLWTSPLYITLPVK